MEKSRTQYKESQTLKIQVLLTTKPLILLGARGAFRTVRAWLAFTIHREVDYVACWPVVTDVHSVDTFFSIEFYVAATDEICAAPHHLRIMGGALIEPAAN